MRRSASIGSHQPGYVSRPLSKPLRQLGQLGTQTSSRLAFAFDVRLIGRASLREGASEIRPRWKAAYDAYFPGDEDRANASFVEVEVERMELWIRDITPEPFGLHPTALERDAAGMWRVVAGDHKAA